MGIGHFYIYFFQVLTGETPFCGVPQPALAYFVLHGKRPAKPVDAPGIGFSDSLWGFTQRCWDGEMELRPKVGELVTHLREAAVGWHGFMLPGPGRKEVSNAKNLSESEILIPRLGSTTEKRNRYRLSAAFEPHRIAGRLRPVHPKCTSHPIR